MLGQGLIDKQNIRYQHFQMMEGLNYSTSISSYVEDSQLLSLVKNVYEMMDYQGLTPEAGSQCIFWPPVNAYSANS